jgi:hypothetical protein
MIYGKRTFLELYLSTIILSGLVWTIFTYLQAAPFTRGQVPLLVGASGGVWGVAMVFVMHYPRKTIYLNFLIPVPIWLMAAIYLFFDLVATIKQENGGVATVAHLSGAALGYLFYRTRWQLGVLLPTRLFQALRRPQVRIHREEEPDDDAMLKEEVDRILEKISREGEASLTTRERRTLEDASRRFQKRRR